MTVGILLVLLGAGEHCNALLGICRRWGLHVSPLAKHHTKWVGRDNGRKTFLSFSSSPCFARSLLLLSLPMHQLNRSCFLLLLMTSDLACLTCLLFFSRLSTQCTNALTGIATNPDAAACLAPGSLVQIIAGGANTSIVGPINTWLTNVCSAPACSNDTISAVVQNVTTGCSNELSGLGLSSDMIPSITSLIQQYYPTARQVICLKQCVLFSPFFVAWH